MALKIVQVAGAALWIAVALSSPRVMAAATLIKIDGLNTLYPAPAQSSRH